MNLSGKVLGISRADMINSNAMEYGISKCLYAGLKDANISVFQARETR